VIQAITKEDNWFVGEDQNIEWHIRDKAGTPIDISGWTIQFRMSVTEGGASVLTKSATQVASARCRVATAAADTTSLAARNYWGTLSRTDTGLNQVLWDERCLLQARAS
jgi:nitrogen fixation protein FixH